MKTQITRISTANKPNAQTRGLSRRALLKLAGAGLGTLAFAEALAAIPSASAASSFIKGADVSWLPQMEANGYIFKNSSGVQEDLLTILKGYGINAIRLRTFVNPSNDPVNGHCSQSETIAMAVRCKNAGLPVDIDFHFGDTWNSVGTQQPPAAWANMTYSQMLVAMQNYVYGFMTAMKASNVTPGWVQIGNEENSGICGYTGSLAHNPAQMTGLLNTAYDQVKAVFPSTPVIIHLAQPQKLSVVENFFDTYKSHGGKWDISGFSSYGSGSEIPGIISDMATAGSRYGKPVMQVEFGGPENNPGQTQASLEAYIKGLQSFGGLGIFYWEPEGYSPFTNYALGAWDATTKEPTSALNGFLTSGGPTPTPPPTSYVKIVNRNSGYLLDVTGRSTADGALIQQWQDVTPSSASSEWQMVALSGGYYKIVNRNSGKVLDVPASSRSEGVQLDQQSDNGGANQQWQVVTSGGYVTIVNRNSGYLLDVSGGSKANGGAVVQWPSDGGANQQWTLVSTT